MSSIPDDTRVAHAWEPFAVAGPAQRAKMPPGAYARARAAAEAHWAAAVAGLSDEAWEDYGSDVVEVSPPIRGRRFVSAGRPDPDVQALQIAIAEAIAAPQH